MIGTLHSAMTKYRLSEDGDADKPVHFLQRNFDSLQVDEQISTRGGDPAVGPRSCSFSTSGCEVATGCYVKHSAECFSSSLPNVNRNFISDNRLSNGFIAGQYNILKTFFYQRNLKDKQRNRYICES